MDVSLVLTVIGVDRPGLVEAVSKKIADHGGNWLESRMSRMAGKFAGILRVSVVEDAAEALAHDLGTLETEGLRVVVERSEAGSAEQPSRALTLELTGQDHPGIVRAIARTLATRGVNVEELATELRPAPMAGGNLFHATAHLRVPAGVSPQDLRGAFEELAGDLMVDITLEGQ